LKPTPKRDAMMQVVGEGAYFMPSNAAPSAAARSSGILPHPWDKITQTPEIQGRDGLAFVRGSYTALYPGQNRPLLHRDLAEAAGRRRRITRKSGTG
jgi:hypothetical protein